MPVTFSDQALNTFLNETTHYTRNVPPEAEQLADDLRRTIVKFLSSAQAPVKPSLPYVDIVELIQSGNPPAENLDPATILSGLHYYADIGDTANIEAAQQLYWALTDALQMDASN